MLSVSFRNVEKRYDLEAWLPQSAAWLPPRAAEHLRPSGVVCLGSLASPFGSVALPRRPEAFEAWQGVEKRNALALAAWPASTFGAARFPIAKPKLGEEKTVLENSQIFSALKSLWV